jgi:hypothetical protein
MSNVPVPSISAMHRRFTSPDEWRSMIEPRFSGNLYTPRRNSFSIYARLEKLARVLLLDIHRGPARETDGRFGECDCECPDRRSADLRHGGDLVLRDHGYSGA